MLICFKYGPTPGYISGTYQISYIIFGSYEPEPEFSSYSGLPDLEIRLRSGFRLDNPVPVVPYHAIWSYYSCKVPTKYLMLIKYLLDTI